MAERLGNAVADVLRDIRRRFDSDPARQAREAERAASVQPERRPGPTESDLEVAGVPRRNWPWILDEALRVETFALRALRDLDCEALVMTGPKDSGRTGAGSWWVAQVQGGMFVHAEHLIDRWFHERERLDKASRLFLDDLGQEGGSPDQQALIRTAIDCLTKVRCAEMRPTVVATNYASKSFAAYLGDRWPRFRDRLIEHGATFANCDKGFCDCPAEGLRSPERRKKALKDRT